MYLNLENALVICYFFVICIVENNWDYLTVYVLIFREEETIGASEDSSCRSRHTRGHTDKRQYTCSLCQQSSKDAPETSRDAPDTSKDAPETSKDAPETSKDAPETSKDAPERCSEYHPRPSRSASSKRGKVPCLECLK